MSGALEIEIEPGPGPFVIRHCEWTVTLPGEDIAWATGRVFVGAGNTPTAARQAAADRARAARTLLAARIADLDAELATLAPLEPT